MRWILAESDSGDARSREGYSCAVCAEGTPTEQSAWDRWPYLGRVVTLSIIVVASAAPR
jgi:hypothetical protein